MRHILYCSLWGLLVLGGCAARVEGVKAHAPTSEANGPNGLVFTAPDGFEERPQNHMYYHSGLRASISPAYQPGADFDKVAAGTHRREPTHRWRCIEGDANRRYGGRSRRFSGER